MSKVHENTVTDLFVQYLRDHKISALTQLGSSIGGYTPDIVIKENGNLYLCEAEWESSKFEGVIQADTYCKLPESSGSILILYPDAIKRDWQEGKKLDIEKYRYKAFFFTKEQKAVPSKVYSLAELIDWIKHEINGEEIIDMAS